MNAIIKTEINLLIAAINNTDIFSKGEKLTLNALLEFSNENFEVNFGMKSLCDITGHTRAGMHKIINSLTKRKFISSIEKGPTPRIYSYNLSKDKLQSVLSDYLKKLNFKEKKSYILI